MGRYNNSFISREKQRFGLRKLSIGVASVLLGTTVYFGNSVAHADSQVDTVPSDNGSEETDSNLKVPYAAPIKPAQAVKVDAVNGTAENQSQAANSGANDQTTNSNSDDQGNTTAANSGTNTMTINQSTGSAFNATSLEANALSDSTSDSTVDPYKADATKWQGHLVSNKDIDGVTRQYYELTGYTGSYDITNPNIPGSGGIVVAPNADDFKAAGIDIGNAEVGVTSSFIKQFFKNITSNKLRVNDFYLSDTGNSEIKALDSDWSYAFSNCGVETLGLLRLDTSNITNMSHMFYSNHLYNASYSSWNTSHVTNMSGMFESCGNVSDNMLSWDVSHVTDMSSMFADISGYEDFPLSFIGWWDVENVTNMKDMFRGTRLSDGAEPSDGPENTLVGLKDWKVGKVTDMSGMFDGALPSFFSHHCNLDPLSGWDISHVTNMSRMFANNVSLGDVSSLSKWNVSHVTNLSNMFYKTAVASLDPFKDWDVGQVTTLSGMFDMAGVTDLTPLANWHTGRVTDLSNMFANEKPNPRDLSSGDYLDNQISDISALANWDVSHVTDMSDMFNNKQVLEGSYVYLNSKQFEGNKISDLSVLNNWQTDQVTNISNMFRYNPIKLADFRKWNLGRVANEKDFIYQPGFIVILSNSGNQALLTDVSESGLRYAPNVITIGSEHVTMPNVYVTNDLTTPAVKMAENLVKQVRNQKLSDYQSSHSGSVPVPVSLDPTADSVDAPIILANQLYQLSATSEMPKDKQVKVVYRYIDEEGHNVGEQSFTGLAGSNQIVDLVPPLSRPDDNIYCFNFKDGMGTSNQVAHFEANDTVIVIPVVGNYYYRTVSVDIKYRNWKDGKDNGEAAPDSVVQLYFRKLGSGAPDYGGFGTGGSSASMMRLAVSIRSSDVITLPSDSDSPELSEAQKALLGWKLDLTKGDPGTPGYHVVSGSFGKFDSTNEIINVRTPEIANWTAVTNMYRELTDDNGIVKKDAKGNPEFTLIDITKIPLDSMKTAQAYVSEKDLSSGEVWDHRDNGKSQNVTVGEYIYYVPNSDLNKTVRRHVRSHFGDGSRVVLHDQTVDFSRSALVDYVYGNELFPEPTRPGKILATSLRVSGMISGTSPVHRYGPVQVVFSNWTPKDTNNAKFASYQLPKVAGYALPAQSVIPELAADPAKDDVYVDVTYTPNVQSLKINYVGLDGQIISSSTVSGHTDENTKLELKAPTGYVLVTQALPTSYTFTADDNQIDVPVTATITYRSYLSSEDTDLHKAVTRTISIKHPTGEVTTVVQTVNFGRNAWTNNLTGKITYSGWEAVGMGNFMAYVPTDEAGYVGQAVQSVLANPKQDNLTVETGYTALSQAVQHPYIDVSGKAYDVVPSGYHVVAGQNANDGAQLIVKDVKPTVPKIEYVTRTITINMPNGKTRTIRQRVLKGHSFMAAHLPKLRGYQTKISEDPDQAGIGSYVADHDVNVVVSFIR